MTHHDRQIWLGVFCIVGTIASYLLMVAAVCGALK